MNKLCVPAVLLTVCTIRQLPQALTLADSFRQHNPDASADSFAIGLADDQGQLPRDFSLPYPLLSVTDVLSAERVAALSAQYTPTEFAAACKPHFIQAAFERFSGESLTYVDPNMYFYGSLMTITNRLAQANTLLTPHITGAPADGLQPDEKYFQNVGLYNSDFLTFRRSAETNRLLTWWQDRVTERAQIDFCQSLCADQIWLMHMPVFFRDVTIVKDLSWHVALWNLPQRLLRQQGNAWLVVDAARPTTEAQPLLFANFKGLSNADEGLFPYQTRLQLPQRPDVQTLLTRYQQQLGAHANPSLTSVAPAYGQRSEPAVIRGWRQATVQSLKAVTRFLDEVPLPVIR